MKFFHGVAHMIFLLPMTYAKYEVYKNMTISIVIM
jgi:hypothetical protein